jgi:hypothetical protein
VTALFTEQLMDEWKMNDVYYVAISTSLILWNREDSAATKSTTVPAGATVSDFASYSI